ncbi:hypothetical protein L4D76_11590 [Photobacterium sagamiensis]|uniref:hypothetical protein n=1 Tax=Photobacterium sagamiensis TaxID=2910241 RepID=UPI003D1408BB
MLKVFANNLALLHFQQLTLIKIRLDAGFFIIAYSYRQRADLAMLASAITAQALATAVSATAARASETAALVTQGLKIIHLRITHQTIASSVAVMTSVILATTHSG